MNKGICNSLIRGLYPDLGIDELARPLFKDKVTSLGPVGVQGVFRRSSGYDSRARGDECAEPEHGQLHREDRDTRVEIREGRIAGSPLDEIGSGITEELVVEFLLRLPLRTLSFNSSRPVSLTFCCAAGLSFDNPYTSYPSATISS